MPPAQMQQPALTSLQGILVPTESVNPQAFFANTRRQVVLQKTISAFAGLGATDTIPILQSGILAEIVLKLTGSVVVALPTGTCATTALWPYGILKAARFSANGVSNLINAGGWELRARELVCNGELNDRGVANGIGGASPGTSRTQGTLGLASESWGLGSNVTAVAANTYNFDLTLKVPVAHDQVNLLGAIFAQTSSTALELNLDWESLANLFTLTGTATATVSMSVYPEAVVYSIPANPKGGIWVPNLSAFHSFVKTKAPNAVSNGLNEIKLAGRGVGRQLMRVLFRTFSGTAPGAPLAMTATNYTTPYWRYGGNTTPEQWIDGQDLREYNERVAGSDLGGFAGFGMLDWDSQWAFRDSIDEGAASELRFGFTIPNAVGLTSPYTEYTQETILAGATAA